MRFTRKLGAIAATLSLVLSTTAAADFGEPTWIGDGGRTKEDPLKGRPVIHDGTNPFHMLKVLKKKENNILIPKHLETLAKDRGPEHDHDTHISVINATPYRWRRGFNNSYQLINWSLGWPEYIQPGQSNTMLARRSGAGFFAQDSAGDVVYHVEGTKKPMSFHVKYTPGIQDGVSVQFLEELETLNSAKNTTHKLGFNRTPGGVGFILAGKEGDFLSNDPPLNWMQSQLHEIGDLPLKEITIPRSHHAGQWKNQERVGFATAGNTQTQKLRLYDQLGNGGVRAIDVRPIIRHKVWRECHGTFIGPYFHGMMGASIAEMVDDVNRFLDKAKGELVIFDVFDQETRNGDERFRDANDDEIKSLYKEFKRLKHRIAVPDGQDITEWPLRKFLDIAFSKHNKLRSAVLVRVHPSWAAKKNFPGGIKGFVSGVNFPLKSRWSDVENARAMAKDQLAELHKARPDRSATLYNVDWLLTQKRLSALFPVQSILTIALETWTTMYSDLWGGLTDKTYPNMLTMDNIHGNEQKTFVMTINKCLAARKCGDLGGKVTLAGASGKA